MSRRGRNPKDFPWKLCLISFLFLSWILNGKLDNTARGETEKEVLTGSKKQGGSGKASVGLAAPRIYKLDDNAVGAINTMENVVVMTVVSNDANDLKAEYRAGFVQGKLQNTTVLTARDNTWDNAYLTDASHGFPRQPGPTKEELKKASDLLNANYDYFLQYLRSPSTEGVTAGRFKRLLFRMLGIYHGVILPKPAALDFSGKWLPDDKYFKPSELAVGYESKTLTFMDVYFLNAFNDLGDIISNSPDTASGGGRESCSAFLKRTNDGVILTHNSWMGFLSQTMVQTLAVNDDLFTVNAATPGLISSGTDFGYNNKGIIFNETTHRLSRTVTRVSGLWIFWRSALAEQFSGSIGEFFDAVSLDNTGSYLNGYMVIDANTNETGLVEMSYRCFVFYRSTGGTYKVTARSLDGYPCSIEYDKEMVTPEYLMGINYPASLQVRSDLQSTDNRPARKKQFKKLLPKVTDMESAKNAITYTDPANPLSIFGRWDLAYGETDYPKQVADGSVDAKAVDTRMVREFMKLKGVFDVSSPAAGFWMLYGTPRVNGKPFIWSQSSYSWQKLRDVPDVVDGNYVLIPLYLK